MLQKTPREALQATNVVIKPANFQQARIIIAGTSPYVQNKMSRRAFETMRAAQAEGGQKSRNRKNKEPKDFEGRFKEAIHVSRDGWFGIPCSSLRNSLISACRVAGFVMTKAKLSIFIVPDGFDCEDGQPLVKIIGKPRPLEMAVRLPTGQTDIAVRPIWDEWKATFAVRWDADQFGAQDIINLISRAGIQVGIGSGRPDSRTSNGMGWGTWEIEQ